MLPKLDIAQDAKAVQSSHEILLGDGMRPLETWWTPADPVQNSHEELQFQRKWGNGKDCNSES